MPNKKDSKKFEPQDKRITSIILNHWNDAKGDKAMPSEADLDPDVLEPILDSCFLVKADGLEDGKYNYKFIGKNITKAYMNDSTKSLNYDKGNPLAYRDKISFVLDKKEPVIDEGEFHNIDGDIVKYRLCLVPISSDGVNVESILGGMRYIIEKKG